MSVVGRSSDDWEELPLSGNVTLKCKKLPSNKITSIVDRAILLVCLFMTLLPLLCAFSIAFYAMKRRRNITVQGLA